MPGVHAKERLPAGGRELGAAHAPRAGLGSKRRHGCRERSWQGVSEGQDALHERPAMGHGQPRAGSRRIGFQLFQHRTDQFEGEADDVAGAAGDEAERESLVLEAAGASFAPPEAAGQIPVEKIGRQVAHCESALGGGCDGRRCSGAGLG
jgi:hypothetical protein